MLFFFCKVIKKPLEYIKFGPIGAEVLFKQLISRKYFEKISIHKWPFIF